MSAHRDAHGLLSPHGAGALVDLHAAQPDALRQALEGAPRIHLNDRERADLALLACGSYSPLEGFMGRDAYQSVLEQMHLPSGDPWTLPVALSAPSPIPEGSLVALVDQDGRLLGGMQVQECWRPDKAREARLALGTQDQAHPGVRYLQQEAHDFYLGGPVQVLQAPPSLDPAALPWWRTPQQTRADFVARGWRDVVAFQTRNPMHRAHEYLTRCALEQVDGLLIHPLVGPTREEDVPAGLRMRCYEVLLERYYNPARSLLAVNPAAMRYAGPREAVFHAIVRRNHGCSHFIVGRDHAGVGDYYGTYDAQRIFGEFDAAGLGIEAMCFENDFYCPELGGMATEKTAPPGATRVFLSGSKVRQMLDAGQAPPAEVMRPEVARVLMEGGQP